MVLQAAAEQAGATVGCPRCKFQMKAPAINTTPPSPLSKPAAADLAKWYYSQNGQQTGPVPWRKTRHLAASGQLRLLISVWKDGMPAWAAVDSIQNLCPARPAVSSPPPCPPSPVTGSPPQAIPKHKAKSNVSILGRLTGTLSKLVELANTVREGYGWAVAAVVGSSALLPVIGDFFRPIAPFNFLIFPHLLIGGSFAAHPVREAAQDAQLSFGRDVHRLHRGGTRFRILVGVGYGDGRRRQRASSLRRFPW